MNEQEVGMLLEAIDISYPLFFKEKDPDAVFRVWFNNLKDYEYSQVENALNKHIQTSDYPPKINQLIKGISNPNEAYIVPNRKQTLEMFAKWDEASAHAKANQLTQEEIDKVLEKTAGAEFLAELKKRRNKR